jgi:UDP-N-acetylmuramoylalanine--D-glutamate ligase
MRSRPPLPPGPYLVAGLARSGTAAALALRARGEEVIGYDARPHDDPRLAEAKGRLIAAGVELLLDASDEATAAAIARAGTLVKSPGVPQDARVVQDARTRGRPVIGELELAWRLLPNEFVAVTGTNGKTTTTEWIGHIHRRAALPVAVVGNVGTAASTLIGSVAPEATVVCEASSFQLEDTRELAPEVGVLLNLAEDHLDRHGTFERYVDAKLRIFSNQGNHDVAVAPIDVEVADLGGCGRRVLFGSHPGAALSDRAGFLWWEESPLISVGEIALPGEHNRQNAMAAAAACLARGLRSDDVAAGLRDFSGVPHRLETVATFDGVTWINDSKATNVASTLVGLAALGAPGRNIHLIAGGHGKDQDFSPLAPAVAERCAAVYLIGEAEEELSGALASTGVSLTRCGDLEHAVRDARAVAAEGQTVLLSPACASYDQFDDFEARGDRFRALVEALQVEAG